MLAFANAKLNLGLHVTARRADGYHELETIFHPVKLYDVVEITDAPVTSFVLKGIEIPGDQADNICIRAFELLQKDFNLPGQQITLLKNIPVGAGLGGGSADAAFVLKLLNTKFKLDLSPVQLESYAAKLGADCAFFIRNETVYASGVGNEFSAIEVDLSAFQVVLVKPDIHVSTAEAYASIQPKRPEQSLRDLISLPVSEWSGKVLNDFEIPIFEKYPEIAEIKQKLYEAGATFALMSGSGSSVFGLFEKETRIPELEKKHHVFYIRP